MTIVMDRDQVCGISKRICPRQFATALDIEEKLNNVELRSEL